MILLLLALLLGTELRAETLEMCGVRVESESELGLSETEEAWICGDPEKKPWREIPPTQKEFFLRNFLQARGYHNPSFRFQGGKLHVDAGPLSHVERFEVEGAPPELDVSKRRRLIGEPLTPSTLDEAANWTRRQLQEIGYPCPEITPLAITDRNAIRIGIDPGPVAEMGPVETQGAVDLPEPIFERFTAFVPGQRFDVRLLELSAARILAEDLYLSTYYDIVCRNQTPSVVRRFVPALPRLLTFGVGFDTERGLLARVRFKRVRIGHAANTLLSTLLASFKEQIFDTQFDWHFTSDLSSRLRLVPRVVVERLDETRFETVSTRFESLVANGWEEEAYRLDAELGPVLERTTIFRGVGERHVNSLRLAGRLGAVSHLFEYYLNDPRQGWSFTLETDSQFSGILAEQSVHRGILHYHFLWNLGHFSPPYLILGWRGILSSFFLEQRSDAPPDIPVDERFFLGGDEDIRGFGRKEIPGTEQGFLTALYQGLELRAGEWFDLPLQPLVFFDLAKGGSRARHLNSTLYYSPGFGARYDSPIGTMRATLGYGFVKNPGPTDPEENLQFFFSFGKEF